MCRDGAGDRVGALGGDFDVEVEEFVDAVLILWGGVDEVFAGVAGEVIELGEPSAAGVPLGVPGVELG
jgi:hypothetical protein